MTKWGGEIPKVMNAVIHNDLPAIILHCGLAELTPMVPLIVNSNLMAFKKKQTQLPCPCNVSHHPLLALTKPLACDIHMCDMLSGLSQSHQLTINSA